MSKPLNALQAKLTELGLTAYLVPIADEYLSEYPAPYARRLEYISGFTGSAGLGIITPDQLYLLTDGRYTLQAKQQLGPHWQVLNNAEHRLKDVLSRELPAGSNVGFDPKLISAADFEALEKAVKDKLTLKALPDNLIDPLWPDQPTKPVAPVEILPINLTGQSTADKLVNLTAQLTQKELAACVLVDACSIAWLTNTRGGDLAHTPVTLSVAIVTKNATIHWFVDQAKLSNATITALPGEVECHDPASLPDWLAHLHGQRIGYDEHATTQALVDQLTAANLNLVKAPDPCLQPKATKNITEVEGMRRAHLRDGLALIKFFSWLEDQRRHGNALDELTVMSKLEEFRTLDPAYLSNSFDTIAGVGPNGAIVHYHSTPATNRPLSDKTFLLLDSGAQYIDGTTDVTRTIPLGAVPLPLQQSYTRVLKAHIAIATCVFPNTKRGGSLDTLARNEVWQGGMDYNHGTGHGVGHRLNVHEAPPSFSGTEISNTLKAGMVISNEPGYYETDHYGIRLENLLLVIERPDIAPNFLGFETLTLAPFAKAAIITEWLNVDERAWLDSYHAQIWRKYANKLDPLSAEWLAHACSPLPDAPYKASRALYHFNPMQE